MLRKLLVTTAVSALMIGAAAAQSAPAPAPATDKPAAASPSTTPAGSATTAAPGASATPQFVNTQKPDQYLASKFRGMDVVGTDNAKIGDVSDILFDKTGKIEAYVVSVGGFLGMGAKDVALAPNAFTVVSGDKSKNEDDKLQIAMSKEQLTQASTFEAYNPPRSTTGAGGAGGGAARPAPATGGGAAGGGAR